MTCQGKKDSVVWKTMYIVFRKAFKSLIRLEFCCRLHHSWGATCIQWVSCLNSAKTRPVCKILFFWLEYCYAMSFLFNLCNTEANVKLYICVRAHTHTHTLSLTLIVLKCSLELSGQDSTIVHWKFFFCKICSVFGLLVGWGEKIENY